MSWNEPGGGNNNPKDPWGGGDNQGPPDLDEALKKLQEKLGGMFGGGGGNEYYKALYEKMSKQDDEYGKLISLAAARMAEKLGLYQGFRDGGAIDGYEWRILALALLVNCPGGKFLAGPGLAANQNRNVRLGQHVDFFEYCPHGSASPHHAAQGFLAADSFSQAGIFTYQPIEFQSFSKQMEKSLLVQRLLDQIISALFDCFHGFLNGAIGRHDDHRDGRIPFFHTLQKRKPVHLRHENISQYDVHVILGNDVKCLASVVRGQYPAVDFQGQCSFKPMNQIGLIIHNQDRVVGH